MAAAEFPRYIYPFMLGHKKFVLEFIGPDPVIEGRGLYRAPDGRIFSVPLRAALRWEVRG